MTPRPPRSTLFPYTTLFRSKNENTLGQTVRYTVFLEPVATDAIFVPGRFLSLQGNFSGTKIDRKSTRLNSSHVEISYAVFCLKKKKQCRRQALCRFNSRYRR